MRIWMGCGMAVAAVVATLAGASAQVSAPQPSDGKAGQPPEPGANSFSEGQARQLLTTQGYSDVSPLVNDRQGIWRGTARKDGASVHVSVDYKGHVSATP